MMDLCPLFTTPDSWHRDLIHYLQTGLLLEHWNSKQRRSLCLKSASYQIVEGILFRKNYDGVLLRCLEKEDAKRVMIDLHDGPTGGNFYGYTIAHKILKAGYYWPTLSKDAHAHVRKCDVYQRCGGTQVKAEGPLKPVMIT